MDVGLDSLMLVHSGQVHRYSFTRYRVRPPNGMKAGNILSDERKMKDLREWRTCLSPYIVIVELAVTLRVAGDTMFCVGNSCSHQNHAIHLARKTKLVVRLGLAESLAKPSPFKR